MVRSRAELKVIQIQDIKSLKASGRKLQLQCCENVFAPFHKMHFLNEDLIYFNRGRSQNVGLKCRHVKGSAVFIMYSSVFTQDNSSKVTSVKSDQWEGGREESVTQGEEISPGGQKCRKVDQNKVREAGAWKRQRQKKKKNCTQRNAQVSMKAENKTQQVSSLTEGHSCY